ncbi:MAG: GTPase HflX [Acidiferrobacteraceae bacterium]|nr:GTPase HflX [Acidiferrobacteraceae bacterium]|tara:strand:- start:45866 stop:47152 length:1287 start_codon:yes stop_codon:yes gene_type:complete
MLDHSQIFKERVIIVHDYCRNNDSFESVKELVRLAQSAGAKIDTTIRLSQISTNRKTYVSSGKVTAIKEAINKFCSTLVILESTISPIQERNLERELNTRVIDRVRLILDIFAIRARTREGKLQVELAQLQHLSTRLVRGWSHLERQRGGIGLRGPGETQLETDRRLIGARIKRLKKQLHKVSSQRQLHRRRRQRDLIPLVALVGYTNVGKSLLFNRLTGADVYTADKLFATLDPTVRRIEVPEFGPVLLLDTVGFISNLPTSLVKSFRATLEEITVSQLLLHVVDFSHENHQERMSEVDHVLDEIGALGIPKLTIFNKIDLTDKSPVRSASEDLNANKVWLSAESGAGMEHLWKILQKNLGEARKSRKLLLFKGGGKFRSKLYDLAEVQEERIDEEGNWLLEILIDPANEGRLNSLRGHGKAFAWLD